MDRLEHKFIELKNIDASDSKGTFAGYASTFGNLDSHKDIVEKGAFGNVDAREVKLLWQHRTDQVIGRYLELKEDERGLYVKGALFTDDLEQAKEAYTLMKEGEVVGLSIGYVPKLVAFDTNTGTRTLKEVELYEISVVTSPANELARINEVKSTCKKGFLPQTIREFEQLLRDAGYSRKMATAIASKGFQSDATVRESEIAKINNSLEELINRISNDK